MSYKPLPDNLTIKESSIHGLGLFATKDINTLDKLCNSHLFVKNGHYPSEKYILRLEAGGYINHSSTPNTEIKIIDVKDSTITMINNNLRFYGLYPIRTIKAEEEITLNYNNELCGLTDYKDEEWIKY